MIWIFGDSFAANRGLNSWTEILSQKYETKNYSSNGSSEYRIWKNYHSQKHNIQENDRVIFCHTSPYRIFLKNSQPLLSRLLTSHKSCDLIFNDVFSKNEKDFVNVLKKIWDDDFFKDTYDLYVADLKTVPNSIHITFFDTDIVESFYHIWMQHKGNINHMTEVGNLLISKQILEKMENLK